MPSRRGAAIALSSLGLFAAFGACSENGASPGSTGDGGAVVGDAGVSGIPCVVDDVLARNCRSCHSDPPAFGAPMPLVTWEHLQAPAPSDGQKKVFELVGTRIHDDAKPMPQPPRPRLGPVDAKIIDDFVGIGAPRSGNTCTPGSGADAAPLPLDCTPNVHMRPQGRWTMPKDRHDEYVCYGFDISQAKKRHATAMAPKIDNTKLVHHVVLFQSDRAEDPTPHTCPGGASLVWRMVFAWAPGAQNVEMPAEAGFPLEDTAHYVAQIHYNNVAQLEGESDASGFDMCTTEQLRPHDADVMAFGTQSFRIPRQSQHDITCSMTVPESFGEVRAFQAVPHMHKLGKTLINTLYPAAAPSKPVDMGTQSAWDFNNQVWMRIDALLRPGDVVKTRCAWANPTQDDVGFGPNTEDEMCYAFTMYYPRIEASGFSWARPAGSSICAATPK